MDRIDKISEERLFQNNTEEELKRWCKGLKYFYYMRSRGGHNCEGDSFCVYFRYGGRKDLTVKMGQMGVSLSRLGEDDIAFDPFESYSLEDLDKLKMVIKLYDDLIQPQYVEVFGHKVHIWVMNNRFEISVSGTKDGETTYKVSEEDFEVCRALEKEFDRLGWGPIADDDIKEQFHCISEDKYPELYRE